MYIKISILAVWLLAIHFSFAQGVSQSPFAQFGLGDQENLANARLQGMGGTGLSLINPFHINLKNPSTLAYNRQNVIFEGGFYGQNSNLTSNNKNQRILSGNINYLALLIPITPKNWTIVAGIAPYANANTKYTNSTPINASEDIWVKSANNNYFNSIDGGLNQVFISNAIKLPKGFSIGLTSSLVLGTINRKVESVVNIVKYNPTDISNPTTSNRLDTVNTINEVPTTKTLVKSQEIYRFAEFKLGIGYNTLIKSKYAFGVALTGTLNRSISSERKLINSINSNNITAGYNGFLLYSDTISSEKISARLPVSYAIGFNFDKLNHWTLALDYTLTDYRQFKSFETSNSFISSAQKISFGVEYIPNYSALKGYFNRVVYRAGAYYVQTPYKIKNEQISDFGGSFGLGLPVGRGGIGMLNVAVAIGRRGANSSEVILENYIKFFVGVNINDRWFLRYKVD